MGFRDWGKWRLVVAILAIAVVIIGVRAGLAQTLTITPTPAEVDPASPQVVVLTVTNGSGEVSAQAIQQTATVVVGSAEAQILSKDVQTGIRIRPPVLSAGGRQALRLLDAERRVLAEGALVYQVIPARPLTFDEVMRQREQDRRDVVSQSWTYYAYVALMFGALLFPFVLAIYRGTSGTHTADKLPLGLPVGSFRSILAYSLIAYLGFYVLTSILSVSYFNPPEFLLGVVATVIGFYFGSRSGEEGGTATDKVGAIRGTVRLGADPARGALITLKRTKDGTVPYTRISDVQGRFELLGMLPGEYAVQASLSGAASDEQKVTVAGGSDHEIEFAIKKTTTPQTPPQTGTLEVWVTDPAGAAAVRAVVVVSQAGAEKAQKATDTAGAAKLEGLPAGEYEVEASLAPHAPSGQTRVKVSPGTQSITIKLRTAG